MDTSKQEPISLDEKISLDEALTRHNAKNPNSQLLDVTDQIETAAAARLHLLMEKRDPDFHGRFAQSFPRGDSATEETRSARYRYCATEIVTALWICHDLFGTDWEDILLCLENAGDPAANRLLVRRAGRAMRLLDIIVKVGCLRRGEVAG